MIPSQCPAFFRLNNNGPACGNNYCPNVCRDDVTCPIKPSREQPRVLRHETQQQDKLPMRGPAFLNSIEEAVASAERGFFDGKRAYRAQVFYNFDTGKCGIVEFGGAGAMKDYMTFFQCTVDDIKRLISRHIEKPELEREVNYS